MLIRAMPGRQEKRRPLEPQQRAMGKAVRDVCREGAGHQVILQGLVGHGKETEDSE